MRILSLFLTLILFSTVSIFPQSETCDCKSDLDFLVEKIKKMPSFKKQIKGEKSIFFLNTYKRLSNKMHKPILIEDCYKLLLEQMILVNDIHASIQISKTYTSNEGYNKHPKTNYDISELTEKLAEKHLNDLEGIYNYKKKERIGIYYSENKKDLIGVVLETELKQWEVGDIRFYATHSNGTKYNFYYYNVDTKTPGFVKSLSFENGRIWSYKKESNTLNYELADNDVKVAEFKQINEDTQYLYFKTFGNSKKKELIQFYNNIKDKITTKNVIIDLRSNGGGNSKFSDPFLKLLKNKNVYVLTNCFTGSNGEQFTLKLLKNKNSKHLGQTTRGIIAYGKNYGYTYNTPSGHFQITPTDMNFHRYIKYEGKGIVPEIQLDFGRDWMEQTLELINKN